MPAVLHASRLARRANVQFHLTPADAEKAGFRPCKRCRPTELSPRSEQANAVAKACALIVEAANAPGLETLAKAVNMSPAHFHRVFKALTGVTPKAYASASRSERVRDELAKGNKVTSAIYKAGFNSTGRFYAISTKMLGMKPTEYRAGGAGMRIRFAVGECSLGAILVAATELGVCFIALGADPKALVRDLRDRFRKAELIGGDQDFERLVAKVIAFVERPEMGFHLPLDVRGTAFQQRVWQELCAIPLGETRSYSEVAKRLGHPKATRAVARACGANPIAVVIPCHRVVGKDGSLTGYRWGVERKKKLLGSEGG